MFNRFGSMANSVELSILSLNKRGNKTVLLLLEAKTIGSKKSSKQFDKVIYFVSNIGKSIVVQFLVCLL